MAFSCEKTQTSSEHQEKNIPSNKSAKGAKGAKGAIKNTPYRISKIKIAASTNVFQTPDAPNPKKLERCIKNKLYQKQYFSKDSKTPATVNIAYDILKEHGKESVVLLAEVQAGVENKLRFEAGTRIWVTAKKDAGPTSKKPTLKEVGGEACIDLVNRLVDKIAVDISTDKELVIILQDTNSSGALIKNTIHKIRERNYKNAAPEMMELMDHQERHIGIAAAATLAKFKYKKAAIKALDFAEDLAREKNYSYIPMLYILADFGGPEITEYIKTVAAEDDNPKVRGAAKKLYEKLK